MIATTQSTELTVPVLFAHLDSGRALEALGDHASLRPVTTARSPNMEPEEILIADVRGSRRPREVVEMKLMALSYSCRSGLFSRTHDRGDARRR